MYDSPGLRIGTPSRPVDCLARYRYRRTSHRPDVGQSRRADCLSELLSIPQSCRACAVTDQSERVHVTVLVVSSTLT